MTNNDEDLLPANYQKHKKDMLDALKLSFPGMTEKEVEDYYYLDPQYAQAALLCAAIESSPPSSEPNTVSLTVSPQVAQLLKLL